MSGTELSFHTVRYIPARPHDSSNNLRPTSGSAKLILNPITWICVLAAIGFISLFTIVVVLPTFDLSQRAFQLVALVVAMSAMAANWYLQRTLFENSRNDPQNAARPIIIDVNRVEQQG